MGGVPKPTARPRVIVTHTTAQWSTARDLTSSGYPQVPDSIPAETSSTQINMDLSTYTLKQGSKLLFPVIKANKINWTYDEDRHLVVPDTH